jgi:hypothetical protein
MTRCPVPLTISKKGSLIYLDAVWRLPGGVVCGGSESGRRCAARLRLQLYFLFI